MSLRGDCRPIRENGPGGWRWVRGQKLAFWGSQPGRERSTETPATGKGARLRRSLATDSTGRHPFLRAWRRRSRQAASGKRRQGLRAIAKRYLARAEPRPCGGYLRRLAALARGAAAGLAMRCASSRRAAANWARAFSRSPLHCSFWRRTSPSSRERRRNSSCETTCRARMRNACFCCGRSLRGGVVKGKAPPICYPAVLLHLILCSPHTKGARLATQGTANRLLPVRSLI